MCTAGIRTEQPVRGQRVWVLCSGSGAGLSSDSLVFKFLKLKSLVLKSLNPGFPPHQNLSSYMAFELPEKGISGAESLRNEENAPKTWVVLTPGFRLRLSARLKRRSTRPEP